MLTRGWIPSCSQAATAATWSIATGTRSINAAVASGIAMHTWLRQHALRDER